MAKPTFFGMKYSALCMNKYNATDVIFPASAQMARPSSVDAWAVLAVWLNTRAWELYYDSQENPFQIGSWYCAIKDGCLLGSIKVLSRY